MAHTIMTKLHSLENSVASALVILNTHIGPEKAPDNDIIRVISTSLRRLLVDNELQRAWRKTGFSGMPSIPSYQWTNLVGRPRALDIRLAMIGGANFGGLTVGAFVDHSMPKSEAFATTGDTTPRRCTLRLDQYINNASVIIHGYPIPRRILIQYFANHRGGSHYNLPGEERGSTIKNLWIYNILDIASEYLLLGGLMSTYRELISIAQEIVIAPDIQNFCSAIGRPLNIDGHDRHTLLKDKNESNTCSSVDITKPEPHVGADPLDLFLSTGTANLKRHASRAYSPFPISRNRA